MDRLFLLGQLEFNLQSSRMSRSIAKSGISPRIVVVDFLAINFPLAHKFYMSIDWKLNCSLTSLSSGREGAKLLCFLLELTRHYIPRLFVEMMDRPVVK